MAIHPVDQPVSDLHVRRPLEKEPLVHVLDAMKANEMRGTFFVTERELKRNAENIRLIRSYGQDLGIGLTSIKGGGTAAEYAMQIQRVRDGLQQQYGVTTNIVRQMASSDNEAGMKEAASAMKCWFVGQGLNAVQSKDKQAQSADEVMPHIFGKWTTSLGRNEIVYIRTDYYEKPSLAAEVMMAIKHQKVDNIAYNAYGDNPTDNRQNDSAYRIVSVQDVLDEPAKCYQYPVEIMDLPIEMQLGYGAEVSQRRISSGILQALYRSARSQFIRSHVWLHAERTGFDG